MTRRRPRANMALTELVALAALACVPAGGAAAAGELPWNDNRPLVWADFRGPVPHAAPHEHVAMTAAALRWHYAYSLERSGGACAYRITEIRIEALFDPASSWVKPDHRRNNVLAHEQGHFDLTEVHRRMFEAASRAFQQDVRPCRGRNSRKVARFVEGDIAATLGELYERTWDNLERVQNLYDAQTRHGMNAGAQQDWLARIAAALGGAGWNDLGFEAL